MSWRKAEKRLALRPLKSALADARLWYRPARQPPVRLQPFAARACPTGA
jgi:hypothetical protein